MTQRQVLPMGMTGGEAIPPGKSVAIVSKPRQPFRPERLIITSSSFRLSRWHRIRTWPAVTIGAGLVRMHRALARALHVDLNASHERREEVTEQEMLESDDREAFVSEYDDRDYDEDSDNERWYRIVEIPLNRRERALGPLGRIAHKLADVRRRWQEAQTGLLMIRQITIGKAAQPADGMIPADMFNVRAIDAFVCFEACGLGQEIRVEIDNGSAYPCHLTMAMIGTVASPRSSAEPPPSLGAIMADAWQTITGAAADGDPDARARMTSEWDKIVNPSPHPIKKPEST